MYREITPEDQAKARFQLVTWAQVSKYGGWTAQEWMEDSEVLEYIKEYELDEKLLEHIYYWVWKNTR